MDARELVHELEPDEFAGVSLERLVWEAEKVGGSSLAGIEIQRRFAALEQERKKLRLKARIVDRLPFCPDHRDKVHGKPCRECEVERLRAAIRVDEACWLDAGGVSIGFYADGIKIRGGDFVIYDLIGATDPQVLAASLRRAIADTEGED